MTNRSNYGALFLPLIVAGYAIFSIWEHVTGDYQRLTFQYGMIINLPLLGLSVICLWAEILRSPSGTTTSTMSTSVNWRVRGKMIGTFVAASVAVLLLNYLGYAIAFALLMFALLLLMGVRSIGSLLVLPVATVIIIHVIFVYSMRMPLPKGELPIAFF